MSFIKKNRKYILVVGTVLVSSLSVTAAMAYTDTGGLVPCVNDCDMGAVYVLIGKIVSWAAKIAFSIGVIAFVYAGYEYITSQGDTGKLKKAHEWFKNIFIGLLLVLGAVLIVSTIMQFLLNTTTYNKTTNFTGVAVVK